jgi:cytochrome P450
MAHAMLDNDAQLPPEKSELDIIKDSTSTVYLGGADTTVSSVISFFLAMLVYPDVQRKAQAEIDQVLGKDRLPEIDDAPHLPYVQAVVNECLRWLPVTPIGQHSISY